MNALEKLVGDLDNCSEIEQLDSIKQDWSELEVIKKSLAANKNDSNIYESVQVNYRAAS